MISRLISVCSRSVKVSVSQMTSTYDKLENFEICEDLMKKAVCEGSEFIFFPENFLVVNRRNDDIPENAEPIDSDFLQNYTNLAKEHDIFVSYGGFYEMCDDGRIFNTHLIVDNLGEIRAKYQKVHLFDIDLEDLKYRESKHIEHGDQFTICEDTPMGTCGITTCYDLRFPEYYIYLSNYLDSDTLLIPASFTYQTGEVHWHILMQARAIENQCYIVASAQTGSIDEDRNPTYGHSLLVNPYGKILVDIDSDETNCIQTVDIDMNMIAEVRKNMPCREHRNKDLYRIEYFGE